MNISKTDYVELEPQNPAQYSVIWLHGLGADGHDFTPIVPELKLPKDLPIRFIFPHAKIRPVTLNNGYSMRAWYDILGLESTSREDAEGIYDSAELVKRYVENEHQRGIPFNRIFLGGFSQGAAMSLHTGLRFPEKLAGIIALSGYLPIADRLMLEASSSNRQSPIFMAHGLYDPVIPLKMAQWSFERLTESGYPIEFKTYPMEHSVSPEEIQAIAAWLQKNAQDQS